MIRQIGILLLLVIFMAAMLFYAFPSNVTHNNSSQQDEQISAKKAEIINLNSTKPSVKPSDISR
jgi:biopolymer transport protein ExbD